MILRRLFPANYVFVDGSSAFPVAGGSVEFYETDSTTPKVVYDENGTLLGGVLALDAEGRFTTEPFGDFSSVLYRIVIKNSSGVEIASPQDKVGFKTAGQFAESITDLKAIDGRADNDLAFVAGYVTAGDGGGGEYYFDASSIETDNGGTIIAPDNGTGRWKLVVRGKVNVKQFGATGDDVDDSAAVQSCVNAVDDVYFPEDNTYRIATPITVSRNGVTLSGVRGSSIINSATGNDNTFVFALPNPELNNLITGCKISDLTIQKVDVNPTGGAHILFDRARQCTIDNVNLIGGFYGAQLAGVGQGCLIFNTLIQPGGNVTALLPGSAGVLINRREVDSSDPNAVQDTVDSLWYTEPNSVHLTDVEVFGTQFWSHGLLINACDGVYLNNCYLGQVDTGCITIAAAQENLSLTVVSAVNTYFDGNANTDYCMQVIDSGFASPIISRLTFSNCHFLGAAANSINFSEKGVNRADFDNCDINGAQLHGVNILGGEDFSFNGCKWDGNNAGSTTGANIIADDLIGLTVNGGRMQGGFRGIQTSASAITTNVMIDGVRIRGTSDMPIFLGHDDDADDRVGTVLTDDAATVASATNVNLPVGTEVWTVTGTTTISGIDDNPVAGRSNFNGRTISLIFADSLTVEHNGAAGSAKILLKSGANLAAVAGTTLHLVFDSAGGVWREI